MNKYYDFDVCDIDEEAKTVTCLGYDGKVYRFPLPCPVEYRDCDPGQLEKLIKLSMKKRETT